MSGQDLIKTEYRYYFTKKRSLRWKSDVPTGTLRERVVGDYHVIGSPKEFLVPYRVRTDQDLLAISRGSVRKA